MAANSSTIRISILGDSNLKGVLGNAAEDLDGFGGAIGKMQSSFAGLGKFVLGAGAVAAAGLGALAVSAWGAADESAKIARVQEQLIKQTGASAWTSADGMDAFTQSLSNKIGIDDELIASGESVLLTFTNVQNKVGEGNDVFNQATGLAADMSTVLGTDLSSANMMLGKALNDPIDGVTKLTRSGVTFTDAQKEQIKTLQESGDILGAQKVILGEVSKEFGGAAEAAATPLDRLKVMVGNAQEAFGTWLIPIVNSAAEWLGERLPRAVQIVEDKLNDWWPTLESSANTVKDALSGIGDKVKGALEWLTSPEQEDARTAAAFAVGTVLAGAFVALGVSAGQAAIGVLAATWPILLVVAVVGGLVFAFLKAYENIEAFRNVVNAVKDTALSFWNNALVPLGNWLMSTWNGTVWPKALELLDAFKSVWPTIEQGLLAFYNNALLPGIKFIQDNMDAFKNLGVAVLVVVGVILVIVGVLAVLGAGMIVVAGLIISVLVVATGVLIVAFQKVIQFVWDLAQNIASAIADAARWIGSLATSAGEMASGVGRKVGEAIDWFNGLPGRILGAIGDVGHLLWDAGSRIVGGLIDGITSKFNEVKNTLGNLTKLLPDWKGPAEVDATILRPSGQLLMSGLMSGIASQVPVLRAQLGEITAQIPTMVASGGSATAPAAGSVTNYNVTVNAGVGTNPVDIGRQVQRVLSQFERSGS